MRNDLNLRRTLAIQKFLVAQTNGHGGFTVEIHDPAEVGLAALQITGALPAPNAVLLGAYQKLQPNFQGVLPGSAGGATTTGSGGGGAPGGTR